MKNKLLMLVLSSMLLVGCASTTVDRFPDLAEDVGAIKEVGLVLDVTILADIEGKKIGIDKDKHESVIADTKLALIEKFAEKDIQLNIIHAGSGIFFTPEPGREYFYTEGFNGTDEIFTGYSLESDSNFEKHAPFLRKLNDDALAYAPTLEEGETKVAPMIFSEVPAFFNEMSADRLLVVKVDTREISTAKSIGIGLTTGLVSALLSGGTYIASSTATSKTDVNLSVLNTESGELIWQGSQIGGGSKTVSANVMRAVTAFMGKDS